MSKQEWKNARIAAAIRPAGQILPSNSKEEAPEVEIDPSKWSSGMKLVADYSRQIAPFLIGHDIKVRMVKKRRWPAVASFSRYDRVLTFNLGTLGRRFFDDRSLQGFQRINELLIHEFAHEYAGDHLSRKFYDSMGLI